MSTYIIGEIGQNHNGSVDIAKLIIQLASRPIKEDLFNLDLKPIDAVKLTKRDLDYELSASQMARLYNSPHSFGKTYGEHRLKLELTNEQHFEVFQYAKECNLDFIETLCAPTTLSILKLFIPDYLKVASRDITNLPLIQAMAETMVPIILSTGMASKKELDIALDTISKYHSKISIMHCTSEYPTQPNNVNLNSIIYLKENYPQYTIGFSDHTIGISTSIAAVAMGSKIIEKHITIDRNMKGTDQMGSLGPDGVRRMIRDIRVLEKSIGINDIFIAPSVKQNQVKLQRSVASKRPIKKGEIIQMDDIHLLSPGDGLKWSDKEMIVGKRANCDIPQNEIVYLYMIE
jgi:sialic acid synthase